MVTGWHEITETLLAGCGDKRSCAGRGELIWLTVVSSTHRGGGFSGGEIGRLSAEPCSAAPRFPSFLFLYVPCLSCPWLGIGIFHGFWVWIDLWLLVVSSALDWGSLLLKEVLPCGIISIHRAVLAPASRPRPPPEEPMSGAWPANKSVLQTRQSKHTKLHQLVLRAEQSGSEAAKPGC